MNNIGCAVVFLLLSSAIAEPLPNIQNAALGQFPFIVGFRSDDYAIAELCSGAIVGQRHVLTAATCAPYAAKMLNLILEEFTVLAGCVDLTSPDCQEYAVANVEHHPDFDAARQLDDVAIITVDRPFDWCSNINEIGIANYHLFEEENVIRTGWKGSQLQWMIAQSSTKETCHRYYLTSMEDSVFFCSEPGYTGWADIGGPVVQGGLIHGITIHTIRNAPDCHIRLRRYIDFFAAVRFVEEQQLLRFSINLKKNYKYDDEAEDVICDETESDDEECGDENEKIAFYSSHDEM